MKTKLTYCLFISIFFGMLCPAQNCAGFKTFTIDGWGIQCRGGNPGCYLDTNFDAAFPDGIRIGNENYSITLASSVAVKDFLRSGTPAGTQNSGTLLLPGMTSRSGCARQLTALTLSIGFDVHDAHFGSGSLLLGSLKITSGTFAGMTVSEFLQVANNAIGGDTTLYSFSQLNAAAAAINENFDNGTVDNGYLSCELVQGPVLSLVLTPHCNDGLTGQESISVSGGTAPYTYTLSNGAVLVSSLQTITFTDLAIGTYGVTVTDSTGASSTGNHSFTIAEPNPILATVTASNVSCYGLNNGSITVTTTDGALPHTILWSNGNTNFTIDNLSPGTYTAVITDANRCTLDISAVITQPTAPLTTATHNNAACFGEPNGVTTVTVAGGTNPYTILWSTGATTFTVNNLLAGTYTAVVTDANGCTSNVSTTVRQPAMALTAAKAITNVTCYGGTNGGVTVTPTGGSAPYTILWSEGATTFTRTGLAAGTYNGVVTDAHGCTCNVNATVTQPSAIAITTHNNAACFAEANGAVTLTVEGGTNPYTILWSDGATAFTRTGLLAGTYTAVVTDAIGCTSEASATVRQPAMPLTCTNAITNASCYAATNGAVTVTPSGGSGICSILWTGGATNFTRTDLAAGTYTAVVTDAHGCTSNVSATVMQPSAVTPTTHNNAACYGEPNGVVTVTVAGGVNPYTILWSTGGTAFTANNLLAGNYTAVVTDATGCTANVSTTVRQPAMALTSTTAITNVTGAGGSDGGVRVTASGGSAPYSILWEGGATTFIRTNLPEGTYTAVITDAHDCTSNVSATVTQSASFVAATKSATELVSYLVYPNPVKNTATIEYTLNNRSAVTIQLYNITGQLVNTIFNGNAEAGQKYTATLNAEGMKSGIYSFKLITNSDVVTKSVIISQL